jgi:hypothetical protein
MGSNRLILLEAPLSSMGSSSPFSGEGTTIGGELTLSLPSGLDKTFSLDSMTTWNPNSFCSAFPGVPVRENRFPGVLETLLFVAGESLKPKLAAPVDGFFADDVGVSQIDRTRSWMGCPNELMAEDNTSFIELPVDCLLSDGDPTGAFPPTSSA